MNILIAEDDVSFRVLLQSLLSRWGYTVITACDGDEAWKILCEPDPPQLIILDWLMPGIEGPEIVRRLREREHDKPYYAIIVTACSSKDSAVSALEAGADDFIGKPFDNAELRARVAVGCRMIRLQNALSDQVIKLEATLSQVKLLEGIIPICMYCKKIRDDHDSWNQLEKYITEHSEAMFSHGICPKCAEEQFEVLANWSRDVNKR